MSDATERQAELEAQYLATVADLEPEPTPFVEAVQTVDISLLQTRNRLAELRAQRVEINAEIRQLVADEDLLERMARVARRASTATEGNDE